VAETESGDVVFVGVDAVYGACSRGASAKTSTSLRWGNCQVISFLPLQNRVCLDIVLISVDVRISGHSSSLLQYYLQSRSVFVYFFRASVLMNVRGLEQT
jgi:hypothetical protein